MPILFNPFLEFCLLTPTFSAIILLHIFFQSFDALKICVHRSETRDTMKKVLSLSLLQAMNLIFSPLLEKCCPWKSVAHFLEHIAQSGGRLYRLYFILQTFKLRPRSWRVTRSRHSCTRSSFCILQPFTGASRQESTVVS